MKAIIIAIFALSTIVAAEVPKEEYDVPPEEYCVLCENHTMCLFSGPGGNCVIGDGYDSSGVSDAEKAEIVDVHNYLRRQVAKGYEYRTINGPMPQAADMRKMVWDDELARVAQMWADQCLVEHDKCRNHPDFYVGQNYYGPWNILAYPRVSWTSAILSWYNEAPNFDSQTVSRFNGGMGTGYFTQVIWQHSTFIGCGRRRSFQNEYFVCNYGPGGNIIGKPIYEIGEPCSRCRQGYLCDDGLCEWSYAKLSCPTNGTG